MSFTVNNNVVGTTATFVEDGSDITITLTGADGGTFPNPPLIYGYENEDGDYVSKPYAVKMTVNGNIATGTITTYSSDKCTVDGTFDAPTAKEVPVSYHLTNAEVQGTKPDKVNVGDTLKISLQGASGYTLESCRIQWLDDSTGDWRIVNGVVSDSVCTITFEVPSDCSEIDVYATGKEIKVPTATVQYNLTNCTVTGDKPTEIQEGGTLTITVQANENAQLKTLQGGYTDENGDYSTTDGTIAEDKKTGTVSFVFPSGCTSPFIYADAEVVAPVGSNYGAINVYLVTLDNLDAFSKKRFFKTTDTTSEGTTTEEINLGVYVNRIKRVFVGVPVSGTDVIKCGNYNTGIECEAPKTDIITVDFGNVDITGLNSDSNDYSGNITLFIPFRGFVTVNTAYLGKEINLTIKANIITGDGVAVLSCNDVPFQFEDITISRDVIYRTGGEDFTLIGGQTWGEQNLYGFEPYLLVENTKTVEQPRNNTNEPVTIGDVTGYAQFENVSLEQTECLENEYDEILNLLNTGVYL